VLGGEIALKTARHMFNILKEAADLQSGASTDSGIGILIIWFHHFLASTDTLVLGMEL
jgi:hypothetical protein